MRLLSLYNSHNCFIAFVFNKTLLEFEENDRHLHIEVAVDDTILARNKNVIHIYVYHG